MDLALIWGLTAAIAWGTADFCAKKATGRHGFWPTIWGMNTVGAIALGLTWLAGGVPLAGVPVLRLIVLGVGNTVGGLLFYYALEFGPLVLVSPITATFPVISGVLAYLLAGERLSWAMGAAAAGVVVGTLLATVGAPARGPGHPRRRSALTAAVTGAVIFGVVFYGLAVVAPASADTAPVMIFRLDGAILLATPVLWGKRLPLGVFRSPWVWATGLLDSSAYLMFAQGARGLPVALIAALSGLFCVWTLILAVPLLGERLRPWQWAGVALIVGAIAMLGIK